MKQWEAAMRGRVLGFDETTGEGHIRGDDGSRYAVARPEIRLTDGALDQGERVDFEPSADGRALAIYIVDDEDHGKSSIGERIFTWAIGTIFVLSLAQGMLGSWPKFW
jgi:cold shock CspA family protein